MADMTTKSVVERMLAAMEAGNFETWRLAFSVLDHLRNGVEGGVPDGLKFWPGSLAMTPGIIGAFQPTKRGIDEVDVGWAFAAVGPLLARHLRGDWGTVTPDDVGRNDASLLDGSRLLSVYPAGSIAGVDEPIWLITDAALDDDRPLVRWQTMVMFPHEY